MLIFKILHYSLAQQNAPGSCCTFSFFSPYPPLTSFTFFFPSALSENIHAAKGYWLKSLSFAMLYFDYLDKGMIFESLLYPKRMS